MRCTQITGPPTSAPLPPGGSLGGRAALRLESRVHAQMKMCTVTLVPDLKVNNGFRLEAFKLFFSRVRS
eukprot:2968535-Rhodomonas_salina.2